jgi:hypothetical protein
VLVRRDGECLAVVRRVCDDVCTLIDRDRSTVAAPRFQLIPGARLTGSGSGGVGWRLLGANNRELGRSALAYAEAESALAAIGRLRSTASDDVSHVLHDQRTGLWVWQLIDDGALVATSGRGFRHERECRYNLEQFRSAAPTAPTSDGEVPLEFPWQRHSADAIQTTGGVT